MCFMFWGFQERPDITATFKCCSVSSISANQTIFMLLPCLSMCISMFIFSRVRFISHTLYIYLHFFLGPEHAWTNRPVEESLAQSHSPAAPGVREDTRCSGHTQQQAFPINAAPAVARGHSVRPPLTHCISSHSSQSPSSFPSAPPGWAFLTLLWIAWPFSWAGILQVSDQLNRTPDKDGRTDRTVEGGLKDSWMSWMRSVIWRKESERSRNVKASRQAIDHPDDPLLTSSQQKDVSASNAVHHIDSNSWATSVH